MRLLKLDIVIWVAGALAILIGLIQALNLSRSHQIYPPYSLDSPQRRGLKALRLLIEEEGIPIVLLRRDDEFRDGRKLILFFQPLYPLEEREMRRLLREVEEGSVLLVSAKDPYLLSQFLYHPEEASYQEPIHKPLISPQTVSTFPEQKYSVGTGSLVMPDYTRLPPIDGMKLILARAFPEHKPDYILAERGLDKGKIVLAAFPDSFTNAFISDGDNAKYFLNLVTMNNPGDEVIIYDSNRLAPPTEKGLLSILLRTPIGWASLYALLLIFLLNLPRMIHLSPPVRRETRPNVPTQVETIAGIYRSSGAYRLAVSNLLLWFRREMIRRRGLSRTISNPCLASVLRMGALVPNIAGSKLITLLESVHPARSGSGSDGEPDGELLIALSKEMNEVLRKMKEA